MGKDKRQTTTTTLDPASQQFVDRSRTQATGAADVALNTPGSFVEGADQRSIQEMIEQFLNPFTDQVIGGVNTQFDRLRSGASQTATEAAIRAGAFGGSRHGVVEGTRLAELDRSQMDITGGLLSNQFNDAVGAGLTFSEYQRALRERQLRERLFRQQAAQGFLQQGLGPTGSVSESVEPGNLIGDLAGGALLVAGAASGNPGLIAGGAQQFTGGGGAGPTPGLGLQQSRFRLPNDNLFSKDFPNPFQF